MYSHKPTTPKGIVYLVRRRFSKSKKKGVPPELQQAIDGCATLPQLLELLFSTDFIKDEAIIDAFDKRMDELDAPF